MISSPEADADLEELMLELGRTRFRNSVAKSSSKGRRTDTKSGRALMREAVVKLEKAIVEFRRRAKKRAGAGHSSAALLDGFASGTVAFVAARTVLDCIALQQPLTACANAVGRALEEEQMYGSIRTAARGVLKDTKGKSGKTSIWPDLQRRFRRNARGGKARKKAIAKQVGAQIGAAHTAWARRDRIRLGLTLVELLRIHTGLIEIRTIPRDGKRPHAVVCATDATLNWLEAADTRNEVATPFYLPMRTRPADWTDAWTGGYRLNALARRPIVKARDRRVVEAVERADPKIVYRAASVVQRTPWRVNQGTFRVAKILWDSGAPIVGFMERLDEPAPKLPENPTHEDFERHTRARADWRKKYHQNRGRRVLAAKTMHLAGVHLKVPKFYYPVQLDFRGRMYPIPFFLAYQGDDLARGLLEFADGKPIRDKEQADYFRGAGAGLFGVNRVAQHQRVAWAHQNHDKIIATASDPIGFRWWGDAESPFQFLAWALEYKEWSERPAQFQSRFRVTLDGSCNGLQLYSLLTRDREGADATNVTDSDSPKDLYQVVADKTTARLLADPDPTAALWLEFLGGKVGREYGKRPTMVLPYGGTLHSAINYVRDEYEAQRVKRGSTPFDVLSGGGYRACTFLGTHIWAAIGETVGKAREAMDWMRAVAKITAEVGVPVVWTAPSGWVTVQRYTKYASRRIQTAAGDQVRFVRYREDKDEIARVQQENGLPPNYIHSMDSSVLAFAICAARDKGITSFSPIHDGFGIPAADAPAMAKVLRGVVGDIFSIDQLKNFRDEIQGQLPAGVSLPPLPEYGDLDANEARQSQYLFS